jgi:deoxyuridine 5'-triphosphate nucleotidohydrolase
MFVKVFNGIVPKRMTTGSAGYDLYTPEDLVLDPGLHKIKLGICVHLPENTFGSIRCRSSLCMSVEAGVIDEDYRGEVAVMLRVRTPVKCPRGHAIAQLIVQPYLKPNIIVLGFGSTYH